MATVRCKDGKSLDETVDKIRLVGSVSKVKDRQINKPAKVGEYPVFVEQYGSYQIFTYNRKIVEIVE